MTKGWLVIGMVTGLCLSGCSGNRSIHGQAARAGSDSDIQNKLATTQSLHHTNINVDIQNGKNILFGSVHTEKQKFLAGSVARSVEGSGIVVNRLVVQ